MSKFFSSGFFFSFSLFAISSALASPPALNYSAPIYITAPGTYTGNYQSTDGTPAIEIYTSGQVIIQNCNVTGPGPLIRVWSQTNLIVRNCNGYGIGSSPGNFIETANLKSLLVQNNYVENVDKAVNVYQFQGQGGSTESIQILNNIARNIQSDSDRASFVQFNQVIGVSNVEIAYNQVINEPGKSAVEDNISFYNSSGTAASPILVHDNYVQGAYPRNLSNGFTGTGMTSDGDGTLSMMPGNIEASNNSFISTCDAAMNLAGGYNIHYHDNRMITSSLLPDGSGPIPNGCTWAATAGWNNFNQPVNSPYYINNSIDHNTIAYVRVGSNSPYTDRQDISPGCTDGICHDNISLPNPVTLATESNEWLLWNQKLVAAQQNVGSSVYYNNGSQSIGEGSNPFYGAANGGSRSIASTTPTPAATPKPTATPVPVVTPTPAENWQLIGYENQTLTVPANSTVLYIANGNSVTKIVSGTFLATNTFFGSDPAPGYTKNVELLVNGTTAPPTPTATPLPSATPAPTVTPKSTATPSPSATVTPTPAPVAGTGGWVNLGSENSTVTVATNSTVRYGANGKFVTKVVSGTFTATNTFFGSDPASGYTKEVDLFIPAIVSTPSSSSQWRTIGNEGGTFTVAAGTVIQYGANGNFIQKKVSGTFTASNSFFGGDPAPGQSKSVQTLGAGNTWMVIGYENYNLTVGTNSTVRYGANGSFITKTVSGNFTATNTFFGSDPAPGYQKEVDQLK